MLKIINFITLLVLTLPATAQENRLYLINRNDSSNVVRILFDQTFIVKLSDSLLHRGEIISCTDSSITMTEFGIHETYKISDIQFLTNPYIGNPFFFFDLAMLDLLGLAVTPFVYLFNGVDEGNEVLLAMVSLGAVVLTGSYLISKGETYDLKNDWELRCKKWNTNSMLLPLNQSEIR